MGLGLIALAAVCAGLIWAWASSRRGKGQRARIILVVCLMVLLMFSIASLLGTNIVLTGIGGLLLVGTFIALSRLSPPTLPPAYDGHDDSAGYDKNGLPAHPKTTIGAMIEHIESSGATIAQENKD